MIFDRVVVTMFGTNCYIVGDDNTREAILIDPGGEWETIEQKITGINIQITSIILTHGHQDHTGAVLKARKHLGVPLYYHAADQAIIGIKADGYLTDGDEIPVGGLCLRVLHTPGHTPGGICLFETTTKALLVTGDTLFKGSVGRTDLGGSLKALLTSIREKIINNDEIPGDCVIAPGHMGTTTKQYERDHNMFRRDWERLA